MIHPHIEIRFVNQGIGYGVFATRPIPSGTITWVLDSLDQVLNPLSVMRLGAAYAETLDRYAYANRSGDLVLCWDSAKLMNHNCAPNTLGPGFDFEMAVEDIPAGHELTCDYGSLNIDRPFQCLCGSPLCRHILRPEDFERFAPLWDRRIQTAFHHLTEVEQPLWRWVKEKEAVEEILARGQMPPSCLGHRWTGGGPRVYL